MYRKVALFVLVALTSSAFGGPGREKMEADKKECAESLGIDPESVSGPPTEEMMNDPKMHCFGACMMKKFGKMNDDGTVNVDKMVEHLPPDVPDRDAVIDSIKECGAKTGKDECETAYEIVKCLRDKDVPFPGMRGHHGPPK